MLSSNTPFKIHDENSSVYTSQKSSKKGLSVAKAGLNQSTQGIFVETHDNASFDGETPLKASALSKSQHKKPRKALVDLSNSQVNARIATPSVITGDAATSKTMIGKSELKIAPEKKTKHVKIFEEVYIHDAGFPKPEDEVDVVTDYA
jgi:hypothetical protein